MLSTRAGCTVHSAREAAGTPENHPRATCTLACGADGPSQPRLAPPLRIPHSLTARGEVISVCVVNPGVQSIATGIERGRDCKTSPYKLCTALSINLYPRKIGNTDPVRETRSWYNLIGEAVQSLYGLLFEQSSPSIPVAIDCSTLLQCVRTCTCALKLQLVHVCVMEYYST